MAAAAAYMLRRIQSRDGYVLKAMSKQHACPKTVSIARASLATLRV
jgi:hypothetical protein